MFSAAHLYFLSPVSFFFLGGIAPREGSVYEVDMYEDVDEDEEEEEDEIGGMFKDVVVFIYDDDDDDVVPVVVNDES